MKRSFLSIATIVVVSCLLTSCSKTYMTYRQVSMLSDYTNMFVGKSHNDIVSALGAPDRQAPDGAGGSILIYEETTTTSTSNSVATAYNVNYFSKTYTPGTQTNTSVTQNTSYVHLFINKEGVCYNVKTNHQKTIAEEHERDREATKKYWKIFGITMGASAGLGVIIGVISALLGS